jgi:hypothetical protein
MVDKEEYLSGNSDETSKSFRPDKAFHLIEVKVKLSANSYFGLGLEDNRRKVTPFLVS